MAAISLLKFQPDDIVYDIGCGDGNFLSCALQDLANNNINNVTLNGVEIEAERAASAEQKLRSIAATLSITVEINIVVGNALEQDYSSATCIFMYLIPRGLRLILPILQQHLKHPTRIVTFMNPLPGIKPAQTLSISTESHGEAQWPLYYYELS